MRLRPVCLWYLVLLASAEENMGSIRVITRTPYFIASKAVGPFAMNQYLIACPTTKVAAIIDSGGEIDLFAQMASSYGFKVEHLLQTHAHIDHVAGLAHAKATFDAPIYLHPRDKPLYDGVAKQAAMFGIDCPALPLIDHDLIDEETVTIGDSISLTVMHTPGHCPGHVAFYDRDAAVLFSGDLLFEGSIGRTDLPLAEPRAMVNSLRKVVALPGNVRVFPGHMGDTTIQRERQHNSFVQELATDSKY